MKWVNQGHELDELGKRYLQIKNLYIWGAGKNGRSCLDFLQWLNIAEDFNIEFIDKDMNKVNAGFCGKNVKPVSILDHESFNFEQSIVVKSFNEIENDFEKNFKTNIQYFYWNVEHNSQQNFIQNFVCIYYMYKYGKLLSHWMNIVTTTKCNLNCNGCLNFNNYISNPQNLSLENFKKHIDIVFSKFDMHYSIHFSGGEPFLNPELPQMIRYLSDHYKERYYNIFVITNGTILPGDTLLTELKNGSIQVLIDDYRTAVPLAVSNLPKLEQRLQDYHIKYELGKANFWYDVLNQPTTYSTEEELIAHRDRCNLFLQGFGDGRIYSCGYTQFAITAGLVTENPNDYLNIQDTDKMELLEFRQGYTSSGYVDLCTRCSGIGDDAVKMLPAVQLPKQQRR